MIARSVLAKAGVREEGGVEMVALRGIELVRRLHSVPFGSHPIDLITTHFLISRNFVVF